MSNCEGCPFRQEDICDYFAGAYLDEIDEDRCHLTPSDMDAIRKAIAGEGRLYCLDKFEESKFESGMRLSYLFCVWLANWKGAGSVKPDRELTLEEVRTTIREQRAVGAKPRR